MSSSSSFGPYRDVIPPKVEVPLQQVPIQPVLRTQKQVQEKYGAILKGGGNVHRKTSTSYIRLAKKGEIVMGENQTPIEVPTNTSWEVCPPGDSYIKGEHYVLTKREFLAAYDPRPLSSSSSSSSNGGRVSGGDHSERVKKLMGDDSNTTTSRTAAAPGGLTSSTNSNRGGSVLTKYKSSRRMRKNNYPEEVRVALENEGYQEYQSKRQVWAHKVTLEDLEWFRNRDATALAAAEAAAASANAAATEEQKSEPRKSSSDSLTLLPRLEESKEEEEEELLENFAGSIGATQIKKVVNSTTTCTSASSLSPPSSIISSIEEDTGTHEQQGEEQDLRLSNINATTTTTTASKESTTSIEADGRQNPLLLHDGLLVDDPKVVVAGAIQARDEEKSPPQQPTKMDADDGGGGGHRQEQAAVIMSSYVPAKKQLLESSDDEEDEEEEEIVVAPPPILQQVPPTTNMSAAASSDDDSSDDDADDQVFRGRTTAIRAHVAAAVRNSTSHQSPGGSSSGDPSSSTTTCEEPPDVVVNFLAPWGEQSVQVGDYLVLQYPASNPEVYRVKLEEFLETYEPVEELFAAAFAGGGAGDDSSFERLVKQHKLKINSSDAYGATPLHHACSGNHINLVSILLENGANVNAATDLGETPLYLACENENLEIVGILMEEGANPNALPTHRSTMRITKTPLMLVVDRQNYNIFDYLVACGGGDGGGSMEGEADQNNNNNIQQHDAIRRTSQILEGIEYCYQQFKNDPNKNRKFRNAIFCTLQNQCTNDWLNSISSRREVVFNVMLQLYCNVAWIVALIHATTLYLSSTTTATTATDTNSTVSPTNYRRDPDLDEEVAYGNNNSNFRGSLFFPHVIVLVVVAIIFLCQEVIEAMTLLKDFQYVRNAWNWFEVSTNILVLLCAWGFTKIGMEIEGGDDPVLPSDSFERLLMATAFFQFAYFIAFLRNTFLPFAKFVGGSLQILEDLLPFFITTLIILFVFAFCYYVHLFHSDDPSDPKSLSESFVMVFEMFVKDEGKVDGILDAVFALVMVVILLNVVIAIITQSWEDAMSKADQLFWDFRLDFIEGCRFWEALCCCGLMKAKGEKATQPKPGAFLQSINPILDRSDDWRHAQREHQSYRPLDGNPQSQKIIKRRRIRFVLLDVFNLSRYIAKYILFFGLGLFTFGMLWPRQIRKDLLGSNKKAQKKGRMTAATGQRLTTLLQQEKAFMATKVEALQHDFSDGISLMNQENKHLKDEVATMKQELADMKLMLKSLVVATSNAHADRTLPPPPEFSRGQTR